MKGCTKHDVPMPDAGVGPLFMVFLVMLLLTALQIAAVMLIIVISAAATLLVWCRLFHRAGFHWVLGILVLLPGVNIVMAFYLAFAEWPIVRRLKALQPRPPA